MNKKIPDEILKYLQVSIKTAPWLLIPKKVIQYEAPLGKEEFQSWINGKFPTQPDPTLWSTYGVPEEWTHALRTGERIGENDLCPIHFIEWPLILNYNILNMIQFIYSARWQDIDQIDGIHRYIYSNQKAPSYEQLITIYNIYIRFFRRNHI
jgi:hypothetical protein